MGEVENGVEVERQKTRAKRWNQASILLAIKAFAAERGGVPPTAKEWRDASSRHPSNQTVREHFKTWDEAMRQAGFTPRGRGRPRGARGRRLGEHRASTTKAGT